MYVHSTWTLQHSARIINTISHKNNSLSTSYEFIESEKYLVTRSKIGIILNDDIINSTCTAEC